MTMLCGSARRNSMLRDSSGRACAEVPSARIRATLWVEFGLTITRDVDCARLAPSADLDVVLAARDLHTSVLWLDAATVHEDPMAVGLRREHDDAGALGVERRHIGIGVDG